MALIDDINKELASAQADLQTATDAVTTAQAAQATAQTKVDALNSLSTITPEQLTILDAIVSEEVAAEEATPELPPADTTEPTA